MANKGIDKIIGTFQSADHKTAITYFQYMPHGVDEQNPPKAVVQIIHGMCEYIERYEHFAAFLAEQNIMVCGADHIGHGRSVTSECELGYFGEKGGDRILTKDAYQLTKKMKLQYPDVPYFYFGHSMGSFVLRDLLAKYQPQVSGAIICGTAGGGLPYGAAKALIALRRKVSSSHYRSRFLNKLMFGTYCNQIEDATSAHDWITRDKAVVEKYDADPKCNYIFTTAAMQDLVTLLARISAKDWAEKLSKDTPLYLIAGDADPVGNYGKGVTEVYEKLKQADIKDVKLKLYRDDRHELLNELDKEQVMEDILDWLKAHGVTI